MSALLMNEAEGAAPPNPPIPALGLPEPATSPVALAPPAEEAPPAPEPLATRWFDSLREDPVEPEPAAEHDAAAELDRVELEAFGADYLKAGITDIEDTDTEDTDIEDVETGAVEVVQAAVSVAGETPVIPTLRPAPEIDEHLKGALGCDIEDELAWRPSTVEMSTGPIGDEPVGRGTVDEAPIDEVPIDEVPTRSEPVTDELTAEEECVEPDLPDAVPESDEPHADGNDPVAELLETISEGHRRRREPSARRAIEPPLIDATDTAASSGIVLPNEPALDTAIDALRVVALGARQAARSLPRGALTTELVDGLVGAVAVARDDSVDFVTAHRCDRWGINPDMALAVADSNTRDTGEISREVVLVGDAETTVLESRLPVAPAALAWLEDVVETPLPVGALIVIASPHLVMIQASHSRSQSVVETLMSFATEESANQGDLLAPTMMLNTQDGLEVVGDLGSAAGRLGMSAATARLTGI